MAHVVGVLKRDPCQKCQLPVFLAERMAVGKRIYHRTCLKCARCRTQLTPGSFYETEVDDEYCCETCPDEEIDDLANNDELLLRSNAYDDNGVVTRRSVRSSIADRLAFFEKSGGAAEAEPVVAITPQKNISDEEKSKSLQRLGDTAAVSKSSFKMSSAFTNFLNDTVDTNEEKPAVESNNIEKALEEDKENNCLTATDDVEVAPQLPNTPPPTPADRRFTTTAHLQMNTTNNCLQENLQENYEKPLPKAKLKYNLNFNIIESDTELQNKTNNTDIMTTDRINNNDELKLDTDINKEAFETQVKDENDETLDNRNSSKNMTKESADDHKVDDNKMDIDDNFEKIRTELQKLDTESSTDDDKSELHVEIRKDDTDTKQEQEEATKERLSVVHRRLQLFEEKNQIEHAKETEKPVHIREASEEKNEKEIDKPIEITEASEEKMEEEHAKETEKPIEITEASEEKMEEEHVKETEKPVVIKEASEEKMEEEHAKETQMPVALTEQVTLLMNSEITPVETATPNEKEENNLEKTQVAESMQHEPNKTEETKMEATKSVEDKSKTSPVKINVEEYPEDLNPFKSDDENEENISKAKDASNPFDSSDDEIELEKLNKRNSTPSSSGKVPPPRPPPPRISRNPFGDDTGDEAVDDVNFSRGSSLSSSLTKKTPVPTPRSNISQSSTPEPTPRISNKVNVISNNTTPLNNSYLHDSLQNSEDYYGSANSLSVHGTPQHMARNSDMRGSSISLSSSAGGTTRSRKKFRAPLPPTQTMSITSAAVKELFPSNETVNSSKTSSPSSSTLSSPKSARKKRMAPAPPKPARLDSIITAPKIAIAPTTNIDVPKNSLTYPLQSESESKMCDEEKALLEGNKLQMVSATEPLNGSKLRVIPLDASLLADVDDDKDQFNLGHNSQCDDSKQRQLHAEYEESAVVYRRAILPLPVSTPTHDIANPLLEHLNEAQHGRQLEKLKDNKEAQNRNRQSQFSGSEEIDALMSSLMLGYSNKSAQGKWKRRKGPAPALPVPPRKVLQMLPLQEIRHELEIIEVQQQGLEKQGVILEQMIRDRCEGVPQTSIDKLNEEKIPVVQNSKEVEDLILQLFELVNEKNELFRRQAELMYLRRQHRLEQEQADLEYEIRVLMAQPERNKTDSDKSREEALITRMVEVVQLRNEVIECLEMDRLREAEEDMSIKTSLEEHNAKREGATDAHRKSNSKLSKKEKKKQKEAKKLGKSKKIDADKDADETELNEKQLKKNKKKKFPFLGALVSTSN